MKVTHLCWCNYGPDNCEKVLSLNTEQHACYTLTGTLVLFTQNTWILFQGVFSLAKQNPSQLLFNKIAPICNIFFACCHCLRLLVSIVIFLMLVAFFSCSERLQTWQKCSADREWNPWSLPQIPGDLPQPANPAWTWSTSQDLWWGYMVISSQENAAVLSHSTCKHTIHMADTACCGGLSHESSHLHNDIHSYQRC